jgi:L-aspartate oxidase
MSIKTDVLIIGSGIAGLFAALKISEYADVLLVTKKNTAESNTNYAQGGIASVIDPNDTFEKHIKDTLIAGAGLCNKEAVEMMVREGPRRINDLINIGTEFTKKGNKYDLAMEGGHSMPRILHAKDLTGQEVERSLIAAVKEKTNIRVFENFIAIDLITEHNLINRKKVSIDSLNCWGVYALDIDENKVVKIISKATLLATGGLGQVYLHSTNPKIATGDGFAMAYRAGAMIGNMEFIQFHPTSLYAPKNLKEFGDKSFLISEAVRGFGGLLRNQNGELFMEKYDSRKELAPRDIVARAIDSELKKNGEEFVYIDLTMKNSEKIKEHFPNIYANCLKVGIDITKDLIPVVPAAHYACGGIVVDMFGKTSINALYSSGEVTMTGIHGANRLASNSLLEALVYSDRCAIAINKYFKEKTFEIPEINDWDEEGVLSADEKILITQSVNEIKQIMSNYVGIVRSNLRLQRAKMRIQNISEETEELYKRTKIFPELLELRNLITCSQIITESAILRRESRGLHYTIDYPNKFPDSEAKNTIIKNNLL